MEKICHQKTHWSQNQNQSQIHKSTLHISTLPDPKATFKKEHLRSERRAQLNLERAQLNLELPWNITEEKK
jgi:hypothetical protein